MLKKHLTVVSVKSCLKHSLNKQAINELTMDKNYTNVVSVWRFAHLSSLNTHKHGHTGEGHLSVASVKSHLNK